MHRVDPADTASPPGPQPSVAAPAPPAGPGGPGARTATWTVEPGQCFWSIAEAQLGRTWGRPPTAAEIEPYWRRLVDANRGALGDPHNADLVFPGQVFTLPGV